jgi:HAD superfamily hydrolase (TIGR01509 family)
MYLDRLNTKGIPVKPGLFELLDYLKENKIKIALATSTSRETATKNLEVCGVLKYFDELVCGNDVKNGKPHPEVFLTAAKKLGLDPAGCVAYEDSLTGI